MNESHLSKKMGTRVNDENHTWSVPKASYGALTAGWKGVIGGKLCHQPNRCHQMWFPERMYRILQEAPQIHVVQQLNFSEEADE